MVLVGSHRFLVVFSGCRNVLSGSLWYSWVLSGSRRFSVVLVDYQWFSVAFLVCSRRFS